MALARRLDTRLVDAFGAGDAIATRLRAGEVVALPADKNEMFELDGREFPLVTSDVIYHTWMILLRAALDDLEKLVMEPGLSAWSTRLARAALRRARAALAAERERARALAARLAVPARLFGGVTAREIDLPARWQRRVESEIELIEAARGTALSPLNGIREDYGAYRPRGRVAATPERLAYARALTRFERDSFRVARAAECREAVALLDLLRSDPKSLSGWEEFEVRLERLFGPSDDLTVRDYLAALVLGGAVARGRDAGPRACRAGRPATQRRSTRLQAELRRPAAPHINPQVGPPGPHSANWPEATRGLRLFGARRTRVVAEVQRQMDGGAWPPRGSCLLPALFPAAARNELLPRQPESARRDHDDAAAGHGTGRPLRQPGRGRAACAGAALRPDGPPPAGVHAWRELALQAGQRRARSLGGNAARHGGVQQGCESLRVH